jgi:hypothetical protein
MDNPFASAYFEIAGMVQTRVTSTTYFESPEPMISPCIFYVADGPE